MAALDQWGGALAPNFPPDPFPKPAPQRHQAYVTFKATRKPHHEVRVLLGDGAAQVTSGYGGWEVVERLKHRPLTYWKGFDAIRLDIPIMFDAFSTFANGDPSLAPDGKLVDRDVNRLEILAGRGGGQKGEPPRIKIEAGDPQRPGGALIPFSREVDEWIIEGLEWGDSLINRREERVRQACTVKVMQYIVDKTLQSRSVANRRSSGRKRQRGRTYLVKRGDTLTSVSVLLYKTPDRWRDIAKANGIRDPRSLHRYLGKRIKIPV